MHQSMNMTHVPCQNSVQPSVVYQQSKPIQCSGEEQVEDEGNDEPEMYNTRSERK